MNHVRALLDLGGKVEQLRQAFMGAIDQVLVNDLAFPTLHDLAIL